MPSKTARAAALPAAGESVPGTRTKARLDWVDSLKGTGILLVVFGHALGGLIDAGIVTGSSPLTSVFAAIYIFHMPLFFFLTGLFVLQRLQSDRGRFRLHLFTQIAWPYFLWGGVQIITINMAGSLVNHPSGALTSSFVRMLYSPPSQFWFLYGLFFLHGLSLAVGRSATSPAYFLLLIAAGLLVEQYRMPGIWQAIFQMAPYYAIGLFLGPHLLGKRDVIGEKPWLWSILLALISTVGAMTQAIDLGIPGEWPTEASAIATDVRGFGNFYAAGFTILALVCVARLTGTAAPRWLIHCGKQTMPIFVLHILFIAATRIAVLKIAPATPVAILLPLLCLAGVLFPLAIAAIADRIGLSRWIGFR